jgi:hypothetical protein
MIIFTHHSGEPHGILGAQVAATFIREKLSIPTVVVGIERGFSKEQLLRFIDESYASYIMHRTLETGYGRSNRRQTSPSAGTEPG